MTVRWDILTCPLNDSTLVSPLGIRRALHVARIRVIALAWSRVGVVILVSFFTPGVGQANHSGHQEDRRRRRQPSDSLRRPRLPGHRHRCASERWFAKVSSLRPQSFWVRVVATQIPLSVAFWRRFSGDEIDRSEGTAPCFVGQPWVSEAGAPPVRPDMARASQGSDFDRGPRG